MVKMAKTLVNTAPGGGGKALLNALFSVYTEEKKNPKNGVIKKYKIYRILFLKFKFNTAYSTNKVYKVDKDGNKRLVTNRKELFKYLNKVSGENNTIIIPDTDLLNLTIGCIRGSNNTVKINNISKLTTINIDIFGNLSSVLIGDINFFAGVHFRIDGSNKKIIVGDDCMFSYGVEIWTGDGHKIYDLDTGERINEDKDVIIGNHVWIGRNASVHKGAVIPDGCVIGANSFVTHKFDEPNTIIAGTPAKVIKRNIRWEP